MFVENQLCHLIHTSIAGARGDCSTSSLWTRIVTKPLVLRRVFTASAWLLPAIFCPFTWKKGSQNEHWWWEITSWLFTVVAEGLDSGRTYKNLQIVVKTGLEPAPSGFQVRAQTTWLRYFRVINFLNILLLMVYTPWKYNNGNGPNWIFSLPVSFGCINTTPL